MQTIKKTEIFFHAIFWLFSLWLLSTTFVHEHVEINDINGFINEERHREYRLFPFILIVLIGKMILAYANIYLILPKRLKDKDWWKMASQIAILMTVVYLLEISMVYLWSILNEKISIEEHLSFNKLNTLFFICFYGVSVGYGLAKNWWKNEKIKKELEKEKLKTELSYLKSQINPHFFFNTLNNLYALSERKNNPELSSGISNLSDLMRYVLYDAKADFVSLEKEIAHLKNLIEVHQLRYDGEEDFTLSFNITGDVSNKKIAPLIFALFIENAFKHGIEFNQFSFIKIDIEVESEYILFKTSNSNFPKADNAHSHKGIGLENVKRRLQLIYPDRHLLKIKKKEDVYEVKLTIQF